MIFLIVVSLIACMALDSLDSQYVPVSKRFPGLVIGNDNSPVTVDLVYDATCILSLMQVTAALNLTRRLDRSYPN